MDLQEVFVRIGDFIKFKGFLVEFLENRRSSENQNPPENLPEKWTFLSLAFYNAPSLHTVEKRQPGGAGSWRRFWNGSPHRKKRIFLAREKG